MKIADFIKPESISTDLESTGKMDVLGELAGPLDGVCPGADRDSITSVLVERERLATTGIGEGVAIPHGKMDDVGSLIAAMGISRTGIHFDAVDGAPVHIFVALLAPQGSTGDHLKALARISRILKDPGFRARLLETQTPQEAYESLLEEDGKY